MLIDQAWKLALGLALIAALAVVSATKRYLSAGGVAAAVVIGVGVLVAGGLGWLIVLMAFTVLGSALTRTGADLKGIISGLKADRGAKNVLANGLPPMIIAVASSLIAGLPWSVAFTAAVAAATSDTVSTEIGMLSRSPPRRITRPWRTVPPGISGGVSAIGTLAGLLAAGAIALLAAALGLMTGPSQVVLAALVGFAGNLVDSMLGDLAEVKYRCGAGALVEDPSTCDQPVERIGHPVVNNHTVNAIAISIAGVLALLLSMI
ncbi:MAG TPA: DUF92 domain-containing protein [Nitrososphaeria archaeon]|jgi:uncharacterized protein (TIGR00297 family)|nr:DUF92 domain-containing protein [Conexivisphaerales archaeon]HEU16994.1 DUF92 domain-containing protein [Nitrososphaeria archaeon]